MATSSIFANVVVNSEEAAKKIVAAYESCEASDEKPFYRTSFTDKQERAIELIKTQYGAKR